MIVKAGGAWPDNDCGECFPRGGEQTIEVEGVALRFSPAAPKPGDRGGVVTMLELAGLMIALCAKHTNELIERLQKAGVRRDI